MSQKLIIFFSSMLVVFEMVAMIIWRALYRDIVSQLSIIIGIKAANILNSDPIERIEQVKVFYQMSRCSAISSSNAHNRWRWEIL
jgi:hypothetical protein